eukprot:sb/3464497/
MATTTTPKARKKRGRRTESDTVLGITRNTSDQTSLTFEPLEQFEQDRIAFKRELDSANWTHTSINNLLSNCTLNLEKFNRKLLLAEYHLCECNTNSKTEEPAAEEDTMKLDTMSSFDHGRQKLEKYAKINGIVDVQVELIEGPDFDSDEDTFSYGKQQQQEPHNNKKGSTTRKVDKMKKGSSVERDRGKKGEKGRPDTGEESPAEVVCERVTDTIIRTNSPMSPTPSRKKETKTGGMSGSTPDGGMNDVIGSTSDVIAGTCDVISENTYSYTDPDPSTTSSKEQKQEDDKPPSVEDRELPGDRLPSNRDRLPSNTKEPTATMMSREMRADLAARNESLGRDDSVEFSLVDADRDIFSHSFASSADSLERIEILLDHQGDMMGDRAATPDDVCDIIAEDVTEINEVRTQSLESATLVWSKETAEKGTLHENQFLSGKMPKEGISYPTILAGLRLRKLANS